MAFRICKEIERGEIDNTVKGKVTGRIWYAGNEAPMILNLTGNCHPDIAGCRVVFTNPAPEIGKNITESLALDQSGEAGDMTASRRVRVLDVPMEKFSAMKKRGETPPEHWDNCLYLEWYSSSNGRVVIESAEFDVQVTEQQWQLTGDDEKEIDRQSMAAFSGFLSAVEEALDGPDDYPDVKDRPMTEFEWEQFMKHSDRRSERFGEVLDKFMDDPDRTQKVDETMGWNLAERTGEAGEQSQEWQDNGDDFLDVDMDEIPELIPNPLTKGKYWVLDERGNPRHPLCIRTFDLGIRMYHICKEAGFEGKDHDEDIAEMVFQTQSTSAKLAGALNSLAYEDFPLREPGFIVAYLKRALNLLKEALNAHHRVVERGLLSEHVGNFGSELFAIRDDILVLIQEFRAMGEEK